MARHWKLAIVALAVLAVIGLATLPALLRTVLGLHGGVSEIQARRELTQPLIATPTDTRSTAQLFWISPNSPTTLEPVSVEMPLSSNPTQRAKQLIGALIQGPSSAQRTLPADTELLQFYLLPDGTAVADFSEALSTETPSGILSEQMAVDSVTRTLGDNVAGIHQLMILIRGQEADTLAGHVNLADPFPVESLAASPADNSAISAAPSTQSQTPAANVALPLASGSLTPAAPPGRVPATASPASSANPAPYLP